MKIGDDAESRPATKVFSCEGCIDDDDTKNLNVRTGSSGLGPDPVLFLGQPVVVHTGGFDDETWADDIGTVNMHHPKVTHDYSMPSRGGDGSYRLNYSISPGPAVGRAAPRGRALHSPRPTRSGRGRCASSRRP